MKTRRQDLEDLDKKTLIDIQLLLEKRIRSLEKQVGDLRGLVQSPKPKTSQNSSVPPSQGRKPQAPPKDIIARLVTPFIARIRSAILTVSVSWKISGQWFSPLNAASNPARST